MSRDGALPAPISGEHTPLRLQPPVQTLASETRRSRDGLELEIGCHDVLPVGCWVSRTYWRSLRDPIDRAVNVRISMSRSDKKGDARANVAAMSHQDGIRLERPHGVVADAGFLPKGPTAAASAPENRRAVGEKTDRTQPRPESSHQLCRIVSKTVARDAVDRHRRSAACNGRKRRGSAVNVNLAFLLFKLPSTRVGAASQASPSGTPNPTSELPSTTWGMVQPRSWRTTPRKVPDHAQRPGIAEHDGQSLNGETHFKIASIGAGRLQLGQNPIRWTTMTRPFAWPPLRSNACRPATS